MRVSPVVVTMNAQLAQQCLHYLSLSLSRGAMATSSGDDIPAQLAALLGRTITRLRITDEVPPRISVVDLATAIAGKDANHAAQGVAYVKERHPEVTQILDDLIQAAPRWKQAGKRRTLRPPVPEFRTPMSIGSALAKFEPS